MFGNGWSWMICSKVTVTVSVWSRHWRWCWSLNIDGNCVRVLLLLFTDVQVLEVCHVPVKVTFYGIKRLGWMCDFLFNGKYSWTLWTGLFWINLTIVSGPELFTNLRSWICQLLHHNLSLTTSKISSCSRNMWCYGEGEWWNVHFRKFLRSSLAMLFEMIQLLLIKSEFMNCDSEIALVSFMCAEKFSLLEYRFQWC